MTISNKINKLVPFHQENLITSDIEYGFQLTLNIWQHLKINKIISKEKRKGTFLSFLEKESKGKNIGYYISNQYKVDYNTIHIDLALFSNNDIIDGDNITLENLLDLGIKIIDYLEKDNKNIILN